MPTPDLVCPIFEGNLDYFRYFTTQCALFRTKKELSILSGNGGTQFAKDRLLLWATKAYHILRSQIPQRPKKILWLEKVPFKSMGWKYTEPLHRRRKSCHIYHHKIACPT